MCLTSINIYKLKQVRVSRRRYDIEDCKITCPLACYKAIELILDLKSEAVEKFGIISLNTKHRVAGIHIIGIGTLDSITIEPREVFKAAMINNAGSIIAFHNHPSGDPTPSAGDIAITKRLKEAGMIMNIRLVDHLIIGEDRYVSLRERGYL